MKNDLIAWIDAQIEKNNSMFVDGEEEHPEKSVPAQDNIMLCKIKDALGEMSAVEYGKIHDEICDAYKHCMCTACPLGNDCVSLDSYGDDIRHAVEIMKRWKEEQDEAR